MAGRTRTFGLALALIVLLSFPMAVQAAQRGELTIHTDATFGASRGVVLPFAGTAVFAGLFDGIDPAISNADLMVPGGGLTDIVTEHSSLVGGVAVVCVTTVFDAAGNPTGGRCIAGGGIVGVGTLRITTFEPRAGGRFSFDIDLLRAFCSRCPARS